MHAKGVASRSAGATLVALGALGCGGDKSTGPGPEPLPATITVISVVDTVLALARTAQLTATARDQAGNPVAAQFTWATSNASVMTVSVAGLVTAGGEGTATVTATVGSLSGGLRLHVVPADLRTVGMLAADPLAAALAAGLSPGKRLAVQATLATCGSSASSGNVLAVKSCADAVRSEAAAAIEPTDRALLAVLALYADQIERLLGL